MCQQNLFPMTLARADHNVATNCFVHDSVNSQVIVAGNSSTSSDSSAFIASVDLQGNWRWARDVTLESTPLKAIGSCSTVQGSSIFMLA